MEFNKTITEVIVACAQTSPISSAPRGKGKLCALANVTESLKIDTVWQKLKVTIFRV